MIELPEAITLAKQVNETLAGKTITDVFNANSPHKFTFFHGDPLEYKQLLAGRKVISAKGVGMFVDIHLDNNITLSINDGVNLRIGDLQSPPPPKYQLLLTFDNDTFLVFTVAMYGGISVYEGEWENRYHQLSQESISPLSDAYDYEMFNNLIEKQKPNLSLKALLATEQRIPGVGNGVIQDILFNAFLNPRQKLAHTNEEQKQKLFESLKTTLATIVEKGGRDTETNLFGNKGGYKTCLSKNTCKQPCPRCGTEITKENYLGGSVYYCSGCQPLLPLK